MISENAEYCLSDRIELPIKEQDSIYAYTKICAAKILSELHYLSQLI